MLTANMADSAPKDPEMTITADRAAALVEGINTLDEESQNAAIAEWATSLATAAGSATTPEQARTIKDSAAALLIQIKGMVPGASLAIQKVSDAISTANNRESDLESEDSGGGLSAGSGPLSAKSQAFQNYIKNHFMTDDEKNYLKQFQDDKQYAMAKINADGSISETTETVSGAQLKEDFARVKYHTLTDEQKAEMAQKGITLPDGTPAHKLTPQQEVKELGKLEESLDNLEGQKAQELLECGASRNDVKRCHERFEGAREQARGLRSRIEREGELRSRGRDGEANLERAKIQIDRGRLREAVQDAIDEGMLDGDKPAREMTISGGQNMTEERLNQLAANISRNDRAGNREQGGGIV